jgi:hypothetical protein
LAGQLEKIYCTSTTTLEPAFEKYHELKELNPFSRVSTVDIESWTSGAPSNLRLLPLRIIRFGQLACLQLLLVTPPWLPPAPACNTTHAEYAQSVDVTKTVLIKWRFFFFSSRNARAGGR